MTIFSPFLIVSFVLVAVIFYQMGKFDGKNEGYRDGLLRAVEVIEQKLEKDQRKGDE